MDEATIKIAKNSTSVADLAKKLKVSRQTVYDRAEKSKELKKIINNYSYKPLMIWVDKELANRLDKLEGTISSPVKAAIENYKGDDYVTESYSGRLVKNINLTLPDKMARKVRSLGRTNGPAYIREALRSYLDKSDNA